MFKTFGLSVRSPRRRNSPAHSELHVFSGRLRTDGYLGEFRPLSFFGDTHNGAGPDRSRRETPRYALTRIQQSYLCLEKTPVVESPHPVFTSFVVVGDYP